MSIHNHETRLTNAETVICHVVEHIVEREIATIDAGIMLRS